MWPCSPLHGAPAVSIPLGWPYWTHRLLAALSSLCMSLPPGARLFGRRHLHRTQRCPRRFCARSVHRLHILAGSASCSYPLWGGVWCFWTYRHSPRLRCWDAERCLPGVGSCTGVYRFLLYRVLSVCHAANPVTEGVLRSWPLDFNCRSRGISSLA